MNRPGLCFDATGTLIEMTASVGEVYAEIARDFGIDLPAWRLDDAFRHVMRHAPPRTPIGRTLEERRKSEFDWWAERIRQCFEVTDSTIRFEDFHAFASSLFEAYRDPSRWKVRAEVTATLDRLGDSGYPMAVVSNFDHRLPDLLQRMDLERHFRVILTPSDGGSSKPETAIFEAAAAALHTPLEGLVYIGDDASETLDAIARLGIRTLDVESLARFADLPDWLAGAATLPST
jgi:putative hydrolase of the HAD superfamily